MLRDSGLFPGFTAIHAGDPSLASPSQIATDAFHVLQAIAEHPADCIGAEGTVVAFTTKVDKVETNLFGVETGRTTTVQESALRVRPEFAPWVRDNIRFLDADPLSGVRSGMRDLISDHGCHGDTYGRIERGLATVFGVTLPAPQAPGMEEGDWQAFARVCVPAAQQVWIQAAGSEPSARGMALACICNEYAARELGDPHFYDAMRMSDWTDYPAAPDGYAELFDGCYRSGEPAEVIARYERFIAENGL